MTRVRTIVVGTDGSDTAAEDLDADVVVVGNKWIERRIRGSVPSGVNRGADRDVLIVDTTSAQRRRAPEQRPRTASSLAGT